MRSKFCAAVAAALFACAIEPACARDAYVYVSDAVTEKIMVFPIGANDPAPIAAIDPAGAPSALATDKRGDLYAVVAGESIVVYPPGGGRALGSIGYANGITSIRDIAFDNRGDLFASCIRTSDGRVGIAEFPPASGRITAWYDSPTSQTYGIVLGDKDNLFVDTGFYGTAIEYQVGNVAPFRSVAIDGAPSAGGLAFANGELVMSGGTGLWIFAPAHSGRFAYARANYVDFGVGQATGYLKRGADGTLYVPVRSSAGEVRMYRRGDTSYASYSTIRRGLEAPVAVAVGPR